MAAKMLPHKRLSTESDNVGVDADPHDQQQQLTPGSSTATENALPYALLPVHVARKRKKTSWVWHHFLRGAGEGERNVCRHCRLMGDMTSYPKTTGNSTLAVHLLAKHGIAKGEIGSLSPSTPSTPATPVAPAPRVVGSSVVNAAALTVAATASVSGGAPVSRADHAFQMPLPKAANFSVKRQQQLQQQNQMIDNSETDDALLDWVVDAHLGLDVLENASFQAFCKQLNPTYQPPARDALLATVDKQFPQALQKFFFVVQAIPGGVALTLDRWSTPGYNSLTLHWVSRGWALKKCLLEFKHAPSPAFDAWCVSELIVTALRHFNLATKVRAITTDSDPELEASMAQVRQALQDEFAVQKSDAWHLRCVSHILHQCVAAALEKIAVPLANLRTILKFIHDSDALRALYREMQQQAGKAVVKDVPSLDVENKWTTTDAGLFAMLDEAYDVRDVLGVVCTSDAANALRFQLLQGQQRLSDVDWRSLKCVRDFLEQAVAFTAVSEEDEFISASLLPLIYDSLQAHCKKTIEGRTMSTVTTPLTKAAASAFLDVLQKHRCHLWNDLANLAQILDPRVANASVEAVAMKNEIRRTLVDQYGLNVQASSLYQASETPALTVTATPTKPEKQISSLFAAARQARNESQPERVTEDEVDAFFKFTAAADLGCTDVLAWWEGVGAHRFPTMSLLARDTLMIMGSALPPRLFTGSDRLVRRVNAAAMNLDKGLEIATKVRAWNRFQ